MPQAGWPMRSSGIHRELRRRLDKRQSNGGDAGLLEAVTVMGEVGRHFPVHIPQMPFYREAWIIADQNVGRIGRFLGAPELRERSGPDRERLQMIGMEIQLLTRPG